jgi:hypothetical protein
MLSREGGTRKRMPKTKSLLTSLYKREELPLFGYLFPAAQVGKRGEGRFSETYVFFQMTKTWFGMTFFFLSWTRFSILFNASQLVSILV